MRLNAGDFYESEETGLQITSFPPYAAVLAWRGKGLFKKNKEYADKYHKNVILTKACIVTAKVFLRDEKQIIKDQNYLTHYLRNLL